MAIPTDWALPESIRVRLGERAGHQRAMYEDGHLLLILHKPPAGDSDQRHGVFFWRKPDGSWLASTGQTDGQLGLRNLIRSYDHTIDQLDDVSEVVGDAEGFYQVLTAVSPIYRATRNMRAAVQSAREKVREDRELIVLRDLAADAERQIELLYENTRHALDYAIARQSEEQSRLANELNRSSNQLNLIATLFFPLTAMAAIFGMNLQSGLEQTHPILFWLLLGAGIFGSVMMGRALGLRRSLASARAGKRSRGNRPDRIPRDPKTRE